MTAALVTGGARRIGAAIVRALDAADYRLAIHCRAEDAAAETLARACRKAVIITGDLTSGEAPARIMKEAGTAIGPLTLLVNNAAMFEDDTFGSLSTEQFDRQFAVNLRAPLLLMEAFARQVPEGSTGAIVNLIDQRVLKPTPDHLTYSLSKAALWHATRMAAQALAPAIRVNAVAPGPVLPNHTDGLEVFTREVAALPLTRAVPPEAIAEAVVYLARASAITGQMIAVDSGQHIGWRTPDVLAVEAGKKS